MMTTEPNKSRHPYDGCQVCDAFLRGNVWGRRPTREAERQRSGVARDSGWIIPLTLSLRYCEPVSLRVSL